MSPLSCAESVEEWLSVLRELVCLLNFWCLQPLESSDLQMDFPGQVTQKGELLTNSYVLWVNGDGVPVPASLGMEIKLHTTSCTEPSKMNNFVKYENISYLGEVCMSFKKKVMNTVCSHFSTTNGILLDHGLQPAELHVSSKSLYDKCLAYV